MSLTNQIDLLWTVIEKQYSLTIKNEELTEEFRSFIEFFSKMSTKKPVFKKLTQALENFVAANKDGYVEVLSDLALLVDRLRLSLYKFEEMELAEDLKTCGEEIQFRNDSWFALQPIIKAMSIKGTGRFKALEQAFILKTYQNRQLLPYIVDACGDSYTKISELALKDMLPFFGNPGLVSLHESLRFDGGKSELNKFIYLLRTLEGESYQTLVENALSSNNIDFQKEVLRTCRAQEWMKEYLVDLSRSRSPELSQLAKCMFEKLPG